VDPASDVKRALHLDGTRAGASQLSYSGSGIASITLYPVLVRKIHAMIYNGDADPCVPYIENEEWISQLESQGVLKEKGAWPSWFTCNKAAPAGCGQCLNGPLHRQATCAHATHLAYMIAVNLAGTAGVPSARWRQKQPPIIDLNEGVTVFKEKTLMEQTTQISWYALRSNCPA